MKDVVGYEGLYEWDGENVISVARKGTSGKVLKWFYSGNGGRPYVDLYKDGKRTTFYKHMLVWMQYHNQAIAQGYEIHHIDGDFTNNDPRNLQLLTREEHQRLHAAEKAVTLAQAVNCFKEGKLIAVFTSAMEAARQLKLYQGNISGCCNGKRKSTGGYTFSYA